MTSQRRGIGHRDLIGLTGPRGGTVGPHAFGDLSVDLFLGQLGAVALVLQNVGLVVIGHVGRWRQTTVFKTIPFTRRHRIVCRPQTRHNVDYMYVDNIILYYSIFFFE